MTLAKGIAASLLAVGTVGLATPGSAFQFEPELLTVTLSHPAGYVTGDAKAVVLGQLSDDAIPDAAVLHGSDVHFIYAADRRNTWAKLGGSYSSIARLPGAQSNVRDGVLAVGSTGLVRLVWDGSALVRTLVPASVTSTSDWIGASELQVLAVPGGGYEILALAADKRSILRATWIPATSSVVGLSSIGIPAIGSTLRGLQWNTDDELEYAVAGNWGFKVFDSSQSELTDIDEACSGALLQVVPVDGEPDRVAWIRAPAGGSDLLTVVQSTDVEDPPISFFGLDIRQMLLADLGEDSEKELVVLAEACPWVFGLRRDPEFGSTYLSSSSPYYTIDLNTAHSMVAYAQSNPFPAGSGAYGSSTKTPVAAALDMDGDGDDDLFVAGHPDTSAAQRAVVFFGAVVDEEARAGVGECVRAWLPTYSYTHLSATQAGRFEFEIPPLPSSGPAAAATHVRIAVWRQNAGTSHMERAALSPVVLASTVAPVVLNVSNAPTPGAGGELHLEISYLRLDSSGVMLEAYPAYHETLDHSTRILQSNHVYDFVDLGLPDGIVSGSENRPPITPPAGGGGGSSTP